MKRPRILTRIRESRPLALAIGWPLMLLGVVGLFVPVLQGLLFIALGAWLLAPHAPAVRRAVVWVRWRYRAWRIRRRTGRPPAV